MDKIKAFGICLYKIEQNSTKVLLCKSVNSINRWGFLKGVALDHETSEQTALREFEEESGIQVEKNSLEKFFLQSNDLKDIGIYLVNYKNVIGGKYYFLEDSLYEKFLCSENSEVKFFDINHLPLIKKKQMILTQEIVHLLQR